MTTSYFDVNNYVSFKAGLDMLTSLAKAFGDAYKLVQPSTKAGEIYAPYTIRNDTGTLLAVTFDKTLQVTMVNFAAVDVFPFMYDIYMFIVAACNRFELELFLRQPDAFMNHSSSPPRGVHLTMRTPVLVWLRLSQRWQHGNRGILYSVTYILHLKTVSYFTGCTAVDSSIR